MEIHFSFIYTLRLFFLLLPLFFFLSIYLLLPSLSLFPKLSLSCSCQYEEASHFNDAMYSAQFLRSFFWGIWIPKILRLYQLLLMLLFTLYAIFVMRLFLATLQMCVFIFFSFSYVFSFEHSTASSRFIEWLVWYFHSYYKLSCLQIIFYSIVFFSLCHSSNELCWLDSQRIL